MKTVIIGSIGALAMGALIFGSPRAWAQDANDSPQGRLAASVKEIRLEVRNTRNQLQAAVDALGALTKQKTGDLQPAYDRYVAEVKKTHEAAQQTSARAGSMQAAGKDYFGAWQTEVTGIADASLRAKAQRRLDVVLKSYNRVIVSLREAVVAFKPFLSNLDDVQKTLANDVTAGGVKAIRGVVRDANYNERNVLRQINEGIDQLSSMEKKLSSQTDG